METFKFGGHSFQGVRQFQEGEDFRSITKQMHSPVTNLSETWDWNNFFDNAKLAGYDKSDVFMMDGLFVVIPAHNGLFIYGEDSEKEYKNFLQRETYMDETVISYQNLKERLMTAIKCHLNNYGEINMLHGDNIPFSNSYREGVVVEEIYKVYLNENDCLCVETEGDDYCEEDDKFTVANLVTIFEFIQLIRRNKPCKPTPTKKYTVSYVLGTEAVREYSNCVDNGEKWNVSSLCDCGSVSHGEFATLAELEAYKQGIEDATGYLESEVMMTDAEWKKYLEEYFSDDDE